MPTQCNLEPMLFARLDRRDVVADFGGGAITSDAGALLLGAMDKAIGLVERFAACFHDGDMLAKWCTMLRRWSGSASLASRSAMRT